MTSTQFSTFWLGFAFFTVLSMLAGLGLFGMSKLDYINQHLNEITGEIQTKLNLTVTMRRAARERTINLQHLIILTDPFDKDDQWLLFNHHGAQFARARLTLLDMLHSEHENTLLKRQASSTAKNVDIQLEIAELAIENKNEFATELLINNAIPIQKEVLVILDELYQYYTALLYERKQAAEQAYINTYRISWIVGSITLLLGSIIAFIAVRHINIIKRKLTDQRQELKNSQQQLQMALDASNDGLWDWNIKVNRIYYSPRWRSMFGYNQSDDTTHLFFWKSLIHKDDIKNANNILQNYLTGLTTSYASEYRIKDINNNWIWIMDRSKITEYDNDGKPARMVGTHKDISEIKKAEFELKQREHFFKGVLDDMQTAVTVLDPEGTVLFVNDSPLSRIGFNAAMIGMKFWECKIWQHSTDLKSNIERYIKKVYIGLNIIEDVEIHFKSESIWLAISIHPVFDDNGAIEYIVPECRVITERITMENALRRSQKMDAIGQLSGGISHDFNNQLGIVIGYLDMLSKRLPDDGISIKWIKTASRATQRCIDLTQQLLALSRHQPNEIKNINLSTSLLKMQDVFNRAVTPEISIRYCFPDDLWFCSLDESELQDSALNLIINARDSITEGGEILIEAINYKLKISDIPPIPEIIVGDYIKFMLSDNGCGMNKELIDKAFEPFFTTKPAGKGAGLGLSMVYAFVNRYNGYIQIYSEINHSTTIVIYFPRSITNSKTNIKVIDMVTQLPMGNESILIVDDEKDLLELACQYLESLGYSVLSTSSPQQAIEWLEKQNDIDMLFTDIVMPGGISGYDLANKANELHPNIKILLTSGFASMHKKQFNANISILNKPYRRENLAHKIRRVFDSN